MESRPEEARIAVSKKARLSVFDLIVLVAAISLGLALTRSLPEYIGWYGNLQIVRTITTNPGGGWSTSGWGLNHRSQILGAPGRPLNRRPSYWLDHVAYWSGPCLVSMTIAAMALSLRGSGPRRRRRAGRPGMAAGLAVMAALGVEVIRCLESATEAGSPWKLLTQARELSMVSLWIRSLARQVIRWPCGGWPWPWPADGRARWARAGGWAWPWDGAGSSWP